MNIPSKNAKSKEKTIVDSSNTEDIPLVAETPMAKAIREAQESGEEINTVSDREVEKPSDGETPYEELENIYSTGEPLILESFSENDDHEVYVYKCKMRDMGKIIRFSKLVLGEFGKLRAEDAEQDIDDLEQTGMLLDLLENNLEKVFDIAFDLCSIKDRKYLDELETDDGVELIMAILEVNKRFFIQKVIPLVTSVRVRASI